MEGVMGINCWLSIIDCCLLFNIPDDIDIDVVFPTIQYSVTEGIVDDYSVFEGSSDIRYSDWL